jgi:hypothetical protein
VQLERSTVDATSKAPSSTPTTGASAAPLSPLVGQWELKRTCAMIVRALTRAGLSDLIPQDIGELIKGVPENGPLPASWDPSYPCSLAKPPIEHSHTFWAGGTFNSYDENGNQVDDGFYTLVDDHAFTMGITFHFSTRANTLKLDVVIPKDCTTKDCRDALAWEFSVAYPGQTWTRVTSGPHVPLGTGSAG